MTIYETINDEIQLRAFIARGGTLDDPFLPTRLRRAWEAGIENGSLPKSPAEQIAWGEPNFRLVELVNSSHTDGELRLLAGAAEIGAGRELPGLTEMLIEYRDQLRAAVEEAAMVQPVADRLADMVHAETDDEAIALMVAGAEAGSGGRILGLVRELRVRREMKRVKAEEFGESRRVFVAEPVNGVRITNLGEGDADVVQPGQSGWRFVHGR